MVGVLTRVQLRAALAEAGVQFNSYAETLLNSTVFDDPSPQTVAVVERSVAELGLLDGGTMPEVFAAAQARGLALCPPCTGPYLRLAITDQSDAVGGLASTGRAPDGSITVASAPIVADHDFPKGFYLRVVDGVPWLRGYLSDDEHVWSPGDTFLFSVAATNQDTALRQEVAQVRAGLHGVNDELVSTVEIEDHCLE